MPGAPSSVLVTGSDVRSPVRSFLNIPRFACDHIEEADHAEGCEDDEGAKENVVLVLRTAWVCATGQVVSIASAGIIQRPIFRVSAVWSQRNKYPKSRLVLGEPSRVLETSFPDTVCCQRLEDANQRN